MTATLPLTLARISFPHVEPEPALDVGRSTRTSGEVSFVWFAPIEDEPVADTVGRLRTVSAPLSELVLERIGTSPGGVWVLRSGDVRAPILEGDAHDVVGALNVLLSHAHTLARFVPVRAGDGILYAAMGAEEAVELMHGGVLAFTDLETLLDFAAY